MRESSPGRYALRMTWDSAALAVRTVDRAGLPPWRQAPAGPTRVLVTRGECRGREGRHFARADGARRVS